MQEKEISNIETAIRENGEIMTSSAGTSMYPMLRNRRDMVVIKKLDRKLKKYDVPVYRLKSGKLVMHRIIKVTDNGYVIRGDNRFEKEFNVTDDMIIGMLKGFSRNGKYYDCETNKKYKAYVKWIVVSYPLRHVWNVWIKPVLRKIKHFLLKK